MSLGLGIGLGAVSGVLGGVFGRSSARKQFEYQKELINMQNEYNSPAQQMKRLKEAGLNPNLVYSSGNVVGNQSGTGSAPLVPSVDLTGGISAGLTAYQQVENHDLDMQLKEQAILKSQAEVSLMQTQAEIAKSNAEVDKYLALMRADQEYYNTSIAAHDYDVIRKSPNVLSKNSGNLRPKFFGIDIPLDLLDRFVSSPKDWLNKRIKSYSDYLKK